MSSATLFRTEADIDRQRMERSGPIAVDTSLGTVQLRITGDLQGVETVWEAFLRRSLLAPARRPLAGRRLGRAMCWVPMAMSR